MTDQLTQLTLDGRMGVTAFEVDDCGWDHAQYFQGHGTACTDFDVVFIGAGDDPQEALEDALDQAAMAGWDVDAIDNTLSHESDLPENDTEEDNEVYHYVALYLREHRLTGGS